MEHARCGVPDSNHFINREERRAGRIANVQRVGLQWR
jgi:hypothetical protein